MALASTVPPMAYDVKNYQTLGLLDEMLNIAKPDAPDDRAKQQVTEALIRAIEDARNGDRSLQHRLRGENRRSSALVRERMRALW